jgi:hypothetical protein
MTDKLFKGVIKLDIRDSTPDWEPYTPTKAPEGAPNVLLILYDDTGLAAWSPFGGKINMPTQRHDVFAMAYDGAVLANALHSAYRRRRHDLVRIASLPKQGRYGFHRPSDVGEECLVAGTEVVQPRFAVGRLNESITGAFAVAGEQHRALLAVLRQRVVLALPEATLCRSSAVPRH